MRFRRDLTAGEKKLARYIFRDSLNYDNIGVVRRSFNGNTAITPFGSMSFPKDKYQQDFVGNDIFHPPSTGDAHWFVHELAHVWQHYVGMRVILLGGLLHLKPGKSFSDIYGYTLHAGKDLMEYNIEQQGDIIADYYAHILWGLPLSHPLSAYEDALHKFLMDRCYPLDERPIRRVRASLRALTR